MKLLFKITITKEITLTLQAYQEACHEFWGDRDDTVLLELYAQAIHHTYVFYTHYIVYR